MKQLIFCVLLAVAFLSCNQPKSNTDVASKPEIDTCISVELYSCIISYINEIDTKFIEGTSPFYSVYLFDNEGKKYFTIWAFTDFPDYIEPVNPSVSFLYCGFEIQDRDVIIIYETGFSIEKQLFSPCDKNINYANKLKGEALSDDNYDGSWYPQTYSYTASESKINISKSDTLLADFLGEDFLRFEEYHRKVE